LHIGRPLIRGREYSAKKRTSGRLLVGRPHRQPTSIRLFFIRRTPLFALWAKGMPLMNKGFRYGIAFLLRGIAF